MVTKYSELRELSTRPILHPLIAVETPLAVSEEGTEFIQDLAAGGLQK